MIIAADSNIPYVEEMFGDLGTVRTFRGRDLSPEQVADAEILICRSTHPIDRQLLEGSRVRFVATATIGTDHVDEHYLAEQGIPFTNAAGSNANSVAQYITLALLTVAERCGLKLAGRSIGIVGVGNVGSRVRQKALALGMEVVENDPPLARRTGDPRYRPLSEALQCDFVTLHVPLTRDGRDATYHMVDADFIGAMQPQAVLLNSSRGAVVVEAHLEKTLRTGKLAAAVLDVWEGEPNINTALLELVEVGTMHIAGYSLDGKAAGTQMVYEATCEFLDLQPAASVRALLPEPDVPEFQVTAHGEPEDIIRRVARQVYDVREDDARLRAILTTERDRRGEYFDELRRNYHNRREFFNTKLTFTGCPAQVRRSLLGLGFIEAG